MQIRDMQIPRGLVQALADRMLRRDVGSWQLLSDKDCFGHHLETELGFVFPSREEIEAETTRLPESYLEEGISDDVEADLARPGGIAYIRDFSRIVCFAIAGDGAPFCLDYRDDPQAPTVIWWDDIYWRVVAPDFDSFIKLFDLTKKERQA